MRQGLDRTLDEWYACSGRPSIPPEQLLRALLLQAIYGLRSERLFLEQLDDNILYRWFVDLGADDPMVKPLLSSTPEPPAPTRAMTPKGS